MKTIPYIDNIFLLSIPFEHQNSKVKEALKSVKKHEISIEDLIRYKTHFTHINNCLIYDKDNVNPKLKQLLIAMRKFQAFRYNYVKKNITEQYSENFVTLKAANVYEFIDYNTYIRFHNDFDLLFPTAIIENVRSSLIEKDDFITGNFSFPTYQFVRFKIDHELEEQHYELMQMSKLIDPSVFLNHDETPSLELARNFRLPVCTLENKLYFHITLDLHKNISNEFTEEIFWNNFVEESDQNKFKRMKIEDLIWYTSLKMYYETHTAKDYSVKDRMRGLVDVYLLINKYQHSINWDTLLQKADVFEMQPALYYVFSFVNKYIESTQLTSAINFLNKGRMFKENRSKDYGPLDYKLI